MIIKEYIYGLFSDRDYTFPVGAFYILVDGHKYNVDIREVAVLDFDLFQLNSQYELLFNIIKSDAVELTTRIPAHRDELLIVDGEVYRKAVDKHTSELSQKKVFHKLVEHCYCVILKQEHECGDQLPIDFIKGIRDEKGINLARNQYLRVSRELYDYILVLHSPYINIIEVNQIYSKGFYSFFTNADEKPITKVMVYRHDCWMPKTDELASKLKNYFEENGSVEVKDLFMARAKVYLRIENYAMAIIHAVMSLEVVVPAFINEYFKSKDVSKSAIEDFNNKFGLSVRVKTILKIILPENAHKYIDDAGSLIKLRNRIMHEGLTNSNISAGVDLNKLMESCEMLLRIITMLQNKLHKDNQKLIG